MTKTRELIRRSGRILNVISIVVSVVAVALLQDKISAMGPQRDAAIEVQSWTTYASLLFMYLALTEVYDETSLMVLLPHEYKKEQARRQRTRQVSSCEGVHYEPHDEKDSSCVYELVMCGALRRCLFSRSSPVLESTRLRKRAVGLTLLTILAVALSVISVLASFAATADYVTSFQPHYS